MANPVKNLQRTAAEYKMMDSKDKRRFWTDGILNNALYILMVVFIVYTAVKVPQFLGAGSIVNIVSLAASSLPIALGIGGCIVLTGTDLSAGRVVGLSAAISAALLQSTEISRRMFPNMPEMPIIVAILAVMVVGAIIGAVNGSVIAFLKVPPFIATLGMQTLVYGACLIYTGAIPIGGLRNDYTGLATGYVGTRMLSNLTVIAIGVGLIMWFLYNKTRYGKYMYAIGGNESAAEVAGINVAASKIRIYMLAGLLYGLTGFLVCAKSGGCSVNTGMGWELEAIAGCTIGGVSVNGGVGTIPGILVGGLVFEVLKIVLQFLGVESSYTYVAQGLVIIIAVALDLRKYLAKK